MKKRIVKQHDITDCGAACLASIANHYGLQLPIARIRQIASTDRRGTNLLGLIQAAEKLGLNAKGVRADMDNIAELPTPCIAHVIIKDHLHHYVVIYKSNPKFVQIMDPGIGKLKKIPAATFKEMWTGILLLIAPGNEFVPGNQKISVISRFWALVNPHRGILVQALVGAIIYTLLGLSTSIYIQKITDFVLVNGNQNLLNLLSVGMLLLLVFQVFIGALKSLFIIRTGQQIDAQLILGYYQHLLKLPQQFFDTMRAGEILSRIGDAVKIRAFINDVAINLIVNLLIILFSFLLMFSYYWKLALIMIGILPLYFLIYQITNQLNKKREREMMERAAELESQLVESINTIGTIKQLGLERYSNLKTEQRFVRLLETSYTSALNALFSSISTETISRVFTIILLWIGAGFVVDRAITPGELLSFYALIAYFTGPASSLIGMNKSIQNALIAADRLFEILDLEIEESGQKIDLVPSMLGDIQFQNICFSYGSRSEVFDHLNLCIPIGKTSAIVGESGSGKSTIAALLQKLYPLNSGHILLGDYDLDHLSSSSVRGMIGMVPQQLSLFAGNLIENIAPGDPEPDYKKIIDLCTDLGLVDFIRKLPDGLETFVGENGISLSGGQRQRIAVARALYRDPEILILDEATSALDSRSEQYVANCLQKLQQQGKTIIVIAHRLSTIMNADQILVLSEGKLLEQGKHEELILAKGKYYQLWEKQYPRKAHQKLGKSA